MCSRELSKAVAVSAFVLLFTANGFCAESILLTAPDMTLVNIHRDEYGVPHIVAETEEGVFFGQGFAVAQDRLYQMETTRRAAEGKLAEWFGPAYIAADMGSRRIYHTPAERIQIFDALPADLQDILSSYSDGINAYTDSMTANPAVYKPLEFETNGFTMEPWTVYNTIAISHFFAKQFGGRGGKELDRLAELQLWGQALFDLDRPINDPTSPTTIQGGCAPKNSDWQYSDMVVDPAVVQAISIDSKMVDSLLSAAQVPKKLGSFAALISATKSATGKVMLLGCPQSNTSSMNQNSPNIWLEVELYCPTLHFSGMILAGFPFGVIGHNEQLAWTFTSGLSDNTDAYIDSTTDASYSSYWYNSVWVPFDTLVDTIYDDIGTPTEFTHYRTVHGPVFGDDLVNHQVYSYKMTFWNEEWKFMRAVIDVAKASNLAEFEAAIAQNPYSFNAFYAGRDQTIKYWHTGRFQDRTDGVDPRLPHKGDGSEEWGGFIPFGSLPQESNPAQGYFVNWNNKPVCWWDNGDYIVSDLTRLRVTNMYDYVTPIIDGFSFDDLKGIPVAISAHGNYQQAIVVPDIEEFIDDNIVPPGQSGFIDINGVKDTHFDDQWPLHLAWDFKDMLFTYSCIDPVDLDDDGIGDGCCCTGIRGNVNTDPEDKTNVSDVSFLVSYLFGIPTGPEPNCPLEANANSDSEGKVNVSDVSYLVNYLFGIPTGPEPGACP